MDEGADLATGDAAWHTRPAQAVTAALGVDPTVGLTAADATARLERHGRNELAPADRPSMVRATLAQVLDPTSLVLVAAAVVALLILEVTTAVVLGLLILLDIVTGANEALKAAAPGPDIGRLMAPTARVRRNGRLIAVNATELVPGDVVALATGEIVPADGRLLDAAGLAVRQTVVTGQPRPTAKGSAAMIDAAAALGERTTMVYAGSTVVRGTGELVVTATGMATELGAIARLCAAARRPRPPLRRRLDGLLRASLGIALGTLTVAVALAWWRGLDRDAVALLGVTAIVAAVPVVRSTFVRTALAVAVQRLVGSGAAARTLQDAATLGTATTLLVDPTGPLSTGSLTPRTVLYRGAWYTVGGEPGSGRVFHVAGAGIPDFDRLAYLAALAGIGRDPSDGADDPTAAALADLAGWLGVDATATRRTYPPLAELPFDTTMGLAASIHRLPLDGPGTSVPMLLARGEPAAILAHSTRSEGPGGELVPIDEVGGTIEAAVVRLRETGLIVLGLAARRLPGSEETAILEPAALVGDLSIVGLVGLEDPVRPDASRAVALATDAGLDMRLVTDAGPVHAGALADRLGLPADTASGPELAALGAAELAERADRLTVLAHATATDRRRLTRALEDRGEIVAAIGRGVVDAPALRWGDLGVAMSHDTIAGQAASVVVADGDLGTVVRAVGLGRETLGRVEAIIRLQATQLIGLVALVVVATVLGINDGLALAPIQVLVLGSAIALFPVVAIASDLLDPAAGGPSPAPAATGLADASALVRWLAYGLTLGLSALLAYPLCAVLGWGEAAFDSASVPTTMAFLVMGLGTLLAGLASRRRLDWAFKSPLPRFLGILAVPLVLLFLSTELRVLQQFLRTVDLRQEQWGVALLLATVVFWVIEGDKLLRRRVSIRFH